MSTALLILAAVAAGIDWYSVWSGHARGEAVAKSAVPAVLIAAVAAGDGGGVAVLVIIALAFSLFGDVVLLPRINWFLGGLASFLVTNALLFAAFLVEGWSPGAYGARLLVLALMVGLGFGIRIVRSAARGSGRVFGAAVMLYVIVQLAMLFTALGTGVWLAALGGTLLASSDAVLGWNRFVEPLPHGRLKTHVLYHVALVLIAAWAA